MYSTCQEVEFRLLSSYSCRVSVTKSIWHTEEKFHSSILRLSSLDFHLAFTNCKQNAIRCGYINYFVVTPEYDSSEPQAAISHLYWLPSPAPTSVTSMEYPDMVDSHAWSVF